MVKKTKVKSIIIILNLSKEGQLKKIILVLVLSILVSSVASGFDGNRKGFILGGGLGMGMTSYKVKSVGPGISGETNWINEFAIMTDFKIGYAPNEQWEIYYSDKSSWFDNGGKIALHGLGTATVNYYLTPLPQTFYLSSGLGLAIISTPFENNTDTDIGLGVFAGAGYEFAKHFAVQIDFMYGVPKGTSSGIEDTFTGITPRISVLATAF